MMQTEGVQPGRNANGGMLGKLRQLVAAFLLFMFITFTMVAWIMGMLLIMESYDDMRETSVSSWNADVADWNEVSRAAFEKLTFTTGKAKSQMLANHTNEIYSRLLKLDSHPDQLSRPNPLFYSTTLDLSGLKPVVNAKLEVMLQGPHGQNKLKVPLVFSEVRCHYVQRGKISRQICDTFFFALNSICVKVDSQGVPTQELDGVRGASLDVGCYLGTEGMFNPRVTNIWSPGIYEQFSQEDEIKMPSEITMEVRSYSDPAITAGIYSQGYYDFGQDADSKHSTGVLLFVVSSVILCGLCFTCALQYIWPHAPSNSERLKYFYRRYCRKTHMRLKNWLGIGNARAEVPEISAEEILLEQQAVNGDTWTGPRQGGNRLGGAMPPLVQSV